MITTSNNALSLKKDSSIKSDCNFLKSQLNIDLFSLYVESRANISVISNLPLEVKEKYRQEDLSRLDPMIYNDQQGLFMLKKNRSKKEKKFNDILEKNFGINNLYARTSTVGTVKISYVLGKLHQESGAQFNNDNDSIVINFAQDMIKKYIHDMTSDIEEIKFSPLCLNPESIKNQLFKDSPVQKPSYGELSCLSLAKDGLDALTISNITGYKLSTVHSNLKSARIKLNARKTIDAAIKAINLGWIS